MKLLGPTEEQARILWAAVTGLAVAIILVLVIGVFLGLGWIAKQLSPVLLPLAVAGIIAYLLNPVVDFFHGRGVPRMRSILLVFFLAVVLQAGLLATVVPQLIQQTRDLISRAPEYRHKLEHHIERFMEHPPVRVRLPFGLPSLGSGAADQGEKALGRGGGEPRAPGERGGEKEPLSPARGAEAGGEPPDGDPGADGEAKPAFRVDEVMIGRLVSTVIDGLPIAGQWLLQRLSKVGSWVGFLAGMALVPVYCFYFLLEKKGIQAKWTDYLPIHESRVKEELVFVLHSINDALIVFFRSQLLVAMCVGLLLTIGFSIVGLNYAVLLGVMAGILGIVPYLGVMLSIVPAMTIAYVQFEDFLHPGLTFMVFVLVQWAEGLYISPKIIGDRVGLHPLTVIVAIMAGTTLMGGIMGGVLAIPLTAALRTLMFRYVWRGKEGGPGRAPKDSETRGESTLVEGATSG